MSETVDRLRILGPWKTELVKEERKRLSSGQVRVEVSFCGVCHSDIGEVTQPPKPGVGLGHEISGVVIETTSEAFSLGQRVVVLNYGGYAEEVVADESYALPVPDGLSLELASMAEPIACILSGIERVNLYSVSRVAVVGAGFMGLVLINVLAINGLDIVVYDPREEAGVRARGLGAIEVINDTRPRDANLAAFDLVFECSGSASGLELASDLTAVDGTLSVIGYHQSNEGKRNVQMQSWNYRALTVINAHTRSHEKLLFHMARALRMLSVGSVDLESLITGRISMTELPQLFTEAGIGEIGHHFKLLASISDVDRSGSDHQL